jgi:nicotinate dehydrogenase subunit A
MAFPALCDWTKFQPINLIRKLAPKPSAGPALAQLRYRPEEAGKGEKLAMARMNLDVNGKAHAIEADPDMPLLYALRNDLGLNNPHFGCGLAQCGACTVHIDGQPVRSCVTPVSAVGNGKIVTLAGLGTPENPHPIQKAYVEEQVPQCGYCINGWVMTAAAFLDQKKKPSDAEIKEALAGLKCRCGTHMGILRAVKRAAEMMG